jgi:hypothetical protein
MQFVEVMLELVVPLGPVVGSDVGLEVGAAVGPAVGPRCLHCLLLVHPEQSRRNQRFLLGS